MHSDDPRVDGSWSLLRTAGRHVAHRCLVVLRLAIGGCSSERPERIVHLHGGRVPHPAAERYTHPSGGRVSSSTDSWMSRQTERLSDWAFGIYWWALQKRPCDACTRQFVATLQAKMVTFASGCRHFCKWVSFSSGYGGVDGREHWILDWSHRMLVRLPLFQYELSYAVQKDKNRTITKLTILYIFYCSITLKRDIQKPLKV